MTNLDVLARECEQIATSHGFWPKEERGVNQTLAQLALVTSEVAEAMEAVRKDTGPSEHIPLYSALEEEIADAIMRLLDFSVRHHLRIADAVKAKMAYNESRPYKHGKKA